MKFFFKLFLIVILASASAEAQYATSVIPEFSFYKLDNTLFTNKNLEQGKTILIIFFDASCEHCQHAMSIYNKHYSELQKTPVYLVSVDNKESINYFMTKYAGNLYGKKNVTILQDLKNQFVVRFRPRKYPSMFLFDSNKRLLIYDDEPENIGNFLKTIKKGGNK